MVVDGGGEAGRRAEQGGGFVVQIRMSIKKNSIFGFVSRMNTYAHTHSTKGSHQRCRRVWPCAKLFWYLGLSPIADAQGE